MFKTLITACNRYIWTFMHPPKADRLKFASVQHRSLIRAFFCGAVESLVAEGNNAAAAALLSDLKRIADVNWWPDRRFLPPRT